MKAHVTRKKLNRLKSLLESFSFLFEQELLHAALRGTMEPLCITKADFETFDGKCCHVLNMTNECIKRYRGVNNTLINTACETIMQDVWLLSTKT